MTIYDVPMRRLQFDPSNACNLNCVYCRGSSNHPLIQMSLETLNCLMSQTKDLQLTEIFPVSRGEPLCEPRMMNILNTISKYNTAPVTLLTNGTVYENREVLAAPNVGHVHFTISAATPETYERIHGQPLYGEVVKTVEWLEQQPNHPEIHISFIVTSLNMHELDEWEKQWSRFQLWRSLVIDYTAGKHLTPAIIPEKVIADIPRRKRGEPCVLWDMCTIESDGTVRLCCQGGETFGRIGEVPLLEAWRRRCEYGMDHDKCRTCLYGGPV